MMTIIRIVSKPISKEIDSAKGAFEIRYQEADLVLPNGRTRPLEVPAPRDGEYALGLYTLGTDSFSTSQYDRLELRKSITLISLSAGIREAEQMLNERPRAIDSAG